MGLVVLFGASGAGKTTIAEAVAADEPDVQIAFFDRIGVPSAEEMVRDFGSADEWQRHATHQWVRRLAAAAVETPVLLEGQTRPAFIAEAADAAGVAAITAVLVDCDDDVRRARLDERGAGDLAHDDMLRWAERLRDDAADRGLRVIDTTMRGVASCADEVARLLRR